MYSSSRKSKLSVLLMSAIGLGILMFSGCGGNSESAPQVRYPLPGESVTITITDNDTPVYKASSQYVSLPESESEASIPGRPTVIALLKSETYLSENFKHILDPIIPVTKVGLVSFLTNHWDAYIGGVEDKGQNLEAFIRFLHSNKMSLEHFMAQFESSNQALPDFVNELTTTRKSMTRASDPVQSGLAVAKFAWDILKDGKPQLNTDGAFTSILSASDTNWGNYLYAQNMQSHVYKFIVTEQLIFTSYTSVEIQFKVVGTYGATHINLPGYFVPSVYVAFPNIDVNWGYSADADAAVSNVSNIGGVAVNPQMDFLVHTKVSSIIQCWERTMTFRITGQDGIVSVTE